MSDLANLLRYEPSAIRPEVQRIQTPSGPKPVGTPDAEAYYAQIIRSVEGVEGIVSSNPINQYPSEIRSLSWPANGTGVLTLAPRDVAMLGLYRLISGITWQVFNLQKIVEGHAGVLLPMAKFDEIRLDWSAVGNEDLPAGHALITSLEDATWSPARHNPGFIDETLGVFDPLIGCSEGEPRTVLRYLGEFQIPLTLIYWAAHKDIRRGLEARLGQVLAAERWDDRFGRRVVVPEYFGRQVRYSLGAMQRLDAAESAQQGRWALWVTLTAEIEQVELVAVPGFVDGVQFDVE